MMTLDQQIPSTSSSPPSPSNHSDKTEDEACFSGSGATTDLAVNKCDKPVQPVLNFSSTMFGKTSRSFHKRWYEHYPWLEYSIRLDAVFSFHVDFSLLARSLLFH